MPSDDERSEKKFTYDGGDWRRLTSRIKPVLYEKKSEAYPDKNLFQLLAMDPPQPRGRLVTHSVEYEEIQRRYKDDGSGDGFAGELMWDARGHPIMDEVEMQVSSTQSQEDFERECEAWRKDMVQIWLYLGKRERGCGEGSEWLATRGGRPVRRK